MMASCLATESHGEITLFRIIIATEKQQVIIDNDTTKMETAFEENFSMAHDGSISRGCKHMLHQKATNVSGQYD